MPVVSARAGVDRDKIVEPERRENAGDEVLVFEREHSCTSGAGNAAGCCGHRKDRG